MKTALKVAGATMVAWACTLAAPAQDQRPQPLEENVQQQLPRNAAPLLNQQFPGRGRGPQAPAGGRNVHAPFVPPITAAKIQTAIDDAIMFLRSRQAADGSIEGRNTALAALAMLAAGKDPLTDEPLSRALAWLAKQDMDDTYVRGIRANVWEYALRKKPYDADLKAMLKVDYEWLQKAIGTKEGWRYSMGSQDWDNSVTQYGVLGTWAAARGGYDPGDAFWVKMSKHFRGCQNGDGGWGYQTGGSSHNMATAGLATMFLVFDMYHGKSYYSRDNPRAFTGGEAAACLQAVARGMDWLGKAGAGGNTNSYYLYGIERTGVASGRKYIGGRDWFADGAAVVLAQQGPDGSLQSGYGPVIDTSFSALFLVFGGAPVAFNKLEYGAGQDWNLNPRDLANLSKYLWGAYERPLNWHSVGMGAPASEFEAPILFVSGSQAPQFSDGDVKKLREYLERGGTILVEPTDRSAEFAAAAEQLLARLYPPADYPACKLAALPTDHDLYTVIKQDWQTRPKLRGASDGSRLVFIVSDEYMSADWQMGKEDRDAYKLALNLLFYATDLGELAGKFASILPTTPAHAERPVTLTVARVQFGGAKTAPRDWAAGELAWQVLAPYVKHVTGGTLAEQPAVRLGKDKLDGIQVLHLCGREAFQLTDAERGALKGFVQGGGTVLADAYAGSPAFAAAARRELEACFGKLAPLPAGSTLAAGLFPGGVDLDQKARLKLAARRALRAQGQEPKGQKLEVAMAGKRPAVLFSALDVTSAASGARVYKALGYQPESARAVVGNLAAYLLAD